MNNAIFLMSNKNVGRRRRRATLTVRYWSDVIQLILRLTQDTENKQFHCTGSRSTAALGKGSGQLQVPAALPQDRTPDTHYTCGRVSPTAGLPARCRTPDRPVRIPTVTTICVTSVRTGVLLTARFASWTFGCIARFDSDGMWRHVRSGGRHLQNASYVLTFALFRSNSPSRKSGTCALTL
jgi:hypothetical protein